MEWSLDCCRWVEYRVQQPKHIKGTNSNVCSLTFSFLFKYFIIMAKSSIQYAKERTNDNNN